MSEDRKQEILQQATGVQLEEWQWTNFARLLSDMYPCRCTQKVVYIDCFIHAPVMAIKRAARQGKLALVLPKPKIGA